MDTEASGAASKRAAPHAIGVQRARRSGVTAAATFAMVSREPPNVLPRLRRRRSVLGSTARTALADYLFAHDEVSCQSGEKPFAIETGFPCRATEKF